MRDLVFSFKTACLDIHLVVVTCMSKSRSHQNNNNKTSVSVCIARYLHCRFLLMTCNQSITKDGCANETTGLETSSFLITSQSTARLKAAG